MDNREIASLIDRLGAKRVKFLREAPGVTNPGELEYACLENRLVELPDLLARLTARNGERNR